MKGWLVQRSAIAVLALFGILPALLLVGFMLYQSIVTSRIERSRNELVHAYQVMTAAQALDMLVKDAERGQRGYLLNENPGYLAPYETGTVAIPAALVRLQALTNDEPQQKQRVVALQAAIDTKLTELKTTLDAKRDGGIPQALAIVRNDAGENAMRMIVANIAAIIAAENDTLPRIIQATTDDEAARGHLALFGGALILAVMVAAAFALYQAYIRSRQSESVLQATLNGGREGVCAFDAKGYLVAWNRIFVDLLRLPPGFARKGLDLEGFTALELSRPDPIAADLIELEASARRSQKPIQVERTRDDGTIVVIHQNPVPEGGFVTTFFDVTKIRQTEAFYRQSQRMEALGQMTGGIAHDFNNLLTIIIGNLDRLSSSLVGDDKAQRLIEQALRGTERGAKLTQQLLAYARRQPLDPRPFNVDQLLPEVVDLLRKSLDESIELQAVRGGGVWNVAADPSQFELAVLNLALNARDAMPNGGKLTLETANVALDDAYAARHDEVTAGQYVMFAVTDTGTGMPPDVVAKAFDPFFTTKPEGKGTGLGLSMVFGFAKQSGGHVKIYSEQGHGTTVKLYLPRSADPSQVASFEGPPDGDLSGSETILVVEDDDDVRQTVVALLKELGYRVMEAINGATALAMLETDNPIDLLFTDIVMPGALSGRALADKAVVLRPELKVLFTSGYTENAIVHHGRLDPGTQLLTKPYRREQLATKIRTVLKG